jgi:hypothetical protein
MKSANPDPPASSLTANAGLLSNLGIAQRNIGELESAISYFLAAESVDPLNPTWRIHTANAMVENGDLEGAIQRLENVLAEDPANPQAHWQLAYALLLQGRFAEAWPHFAWRWRCPGFPSQRLPTLQPAWDGTSRCQRLLLWSEQGLGDQVMLAGLVPQARVWVESLGADVELLVDGRLVGLLQRAWPDLPIHPWGSDPRSVNWDQHLPLGDLCQHLRPTADRFGSHQPPWLIADPSRVAAIAAELPRTAPLRYGLSWRSESNMMGRRKSLPLKMLASAVAQPGVQLICLQYGDVEDELMELRKASGIVVDRVANLDLRLDIEGLVALIQSCDCVITISNATAHVCGAMGKVTCLLLHHVPYWPWQLTGKASLWYPNLRLFRQRQAGAWEMPLDEVGLFSQDFIQAASMLPVASEPRPACP